MRQETTKSSLVAFRFTPDVCEELSVLAGLETVRLRRRVTVSDVVRDAVDRKLAEYHETKLTA